MRTYAIRICDPCFALQGEMCHVPGCVFCRKTMAEVGRLLNVLMLRPVIDGERITAATPEPEPTHPPPAGNPEPAVELAAALCRLENACIAYGQEHDDGSRRERWYRSVLTARAEVWAALASQTTGGRHG